MCVSHFGAPKIPQKSLVEVPKPPLKTNGFVAAWMILPITQREKWLLFLIVSTVQAIHCLPCSWKSALISPPSLSARSWDASACKSERILSTYQFSSLPLGGLFPG